MTDLISRSALREHFFTTELFDGSEVRAVAEADIDSAPPVTCEACEHFASEDIFCEHEDMEQVEGCFTTPFFPPDLGRTFACSNFKRKAGDD